MHLFKYFNINTKYKIWKINFLTTSFPSCVGKALPEPGESTSAPGANLHQGGEETTCQRAWGHSLQRPTVKGPYRWAGGNPSQGDIHSLNSKLHMAVSGTKQDLSLHIQINKRTLSVLFRLCLSHHWVIVSCALYLAKDVRELSRLSRFHPAAGAGVFSSETPTCPGLKGKVQWIFLEKGIGLIFSPCIVRPIEF